jgi:hypothetical protein
VPVTVRTRWLTIGKRAGAGVIEHDLIIIEFHVLVEPDADGGLGKGRRERRLAHHQRIRAACRPRPARSGQRH